MPTRRAFEAQLVTSRVITPFIKELEFERLDGKPSEHLPGQFVHVVLPPRDEDGRIDRAYSYSSLADGTPRFRVLVTKVEGGLGSTWLHNAQPGVRLPMSGPDGTFLRDPNRRPTLFVASGTGFAPIRTMFEHALKAGHTEPMWLLLGVRSTDEIPFGSDLANWEKHPGMRVDITLSQPGDGWKGLVGHVQTHLPGLWAEFHAQHADAMAYVCGWRRMVWPVKDLLRGELKVDGQHMRVEAFD